MNREILLPLLQGYEPAIEFVLDLWKVVCTWDDLIDKDKPVSDAAISSAFTAALVSLPRNTFYLQNIGRLSPLIESAILDWHTANMLNASGKEAAVREAYVLRCSGYDVVAMCAKIIGGDEAAILASATLRTMRDEWPEYAKKHGVGENVPALKVVQ